MEQNYNGQNPYEQTPGQEQAQNPYTQQPYQQAPYSYQQPYQAPVYPYPMQPRPENVPGLTELTNSAFGKGLASAILAGFPIASIIAIIMGSKAKKQVQEADRLAAQHGTKAPGKRTAAKILGNVGFGLGIGLTVFYTIFFFYMILIIALIAETNYHF